jgi:outer membrane receptor protein involved in Fe transport
VFAGPGASRPVIEDGTDLVLGQGSFAQPLPSWMGAVGGQYDFRILGNQAFFRLDYQHSSATRDLSAQRVLSGRLGAEVGKLAVALFIDNALDFHEYTSITNTALFATSTGPSTNQLLTYSTLPPRTIGLTLTYRE